MSWEATLKARFEERIEARTRLQESPEHMDPELGPCHIWEGSPWNGYGVLYFGGMQLLAHRAAYFWSQGKAIGDTKQCVRHRCDVKSCVNPDHLVVGTIADNNQDAYERGMYKKGAAKSKHGWQDEDVLSWRRERFVEGKTLKSIYEAYIATGRPYCSPSYFGDVVRGAVWDHLPMPEGVKHAPPKKPRKGARRARKL
jgi:hypothetical protein